MTTSKEKQASDKKNQEDWNEHFKNAHNTSWPLPSVGMALDVYERHKEFVDKAAKKFGYRREVSAAKHVRFGKHA